MPNPEFVSLGGSVIAPNCNFEDSTYIYQFAGVLKWQVEQFDQRMVIIPGGGWPARAYQDLLRRDGVVDQNKLDEIGRQVTHVNARLLTDVLNNQGIPTVYMASLGALENNKTAVWISGGNQIGQTTDGALVDWWRILGFPRQTFINLTNIPFVYRESSPGVFDTTKPIRDMTWGEYGVSLHRSGEHRPWSDSQKASKSGLSVIVTNQDLDNFVNILRGKPYKGTLIHP